MMLRTRCATNAVTSGDQCCDERFPQHHKHNPSRTHFCCSQLFFVSYSREGSSTPQSREARPQTNTYHTEYCKTRPELTYSRHARRNRNYTAWPTAGPWRPKARTSARTCPNHAGTTPTPHAPIPKPRAQQRKPHRGHANTACANSEASRPKSKATPGQRQHRMS